MRARPGGRARARLVRYTAKGREVARAAVRIRREIEAEWARAIGARKMAQLRALLDDLADVIERERAAPVTIRCGPGPSRGTAPRP